MKDGISIIHCLEVEGKQSDKRWSHAKAGFHFCELLLSKGQWDWQIDNYHSPSYDVWDMVKKGYGTFLKRLIGNCFFLHGKVWS